MVTETRPAGGIVFHKTMDRPAMVEFYRGRVGMRVWLEQADCTILSHGNLLLGLCQREERTTEGILCFVLPSIEAVDSIHARLGDLDPTDPARNEKYRIYHFFARDPEGRTLEFQTFLDPVEPFLGGTELLEQRRSIRQFTRDPVSDGLLDAVLGHCLYAPSSRDTQPCFYVRVRDRGRLERLAAIRGDSSAPIARASMAIAVCADPGRTARPVEDGCIAATYFLLSAWQHGLGTCWIGGMDRADVKEILGIPEDHYVATVTPVGFPASRPQASPRRPLDLREA